MSPETAFRSVPRQERHFITLQEVGGSFTESDPQKFSNHTKRASGIRIEMAVELTCAHLQPSCMRLKRAFPVPVGQAKWQILHFWVLISSLTKILPFL